MSLPQYVFDELATAGFKRQHLCTTLFEGSTDNPITAAWLDYPTNEEPIDFDFIQDCPHCLKVVCKSQANPQSMLGQYQTCIGYHEVDWTKGQIVRRTIKQAIEVLRSRRAANPDYLVPSRLSEPRTR